ncbi:putative secreted protein (Por secretion system target) [Breznakibacter xylanolyticus]|uniref:Putative secreted protein (Por secretion system target) n=2 Tax=Breznakibacter xylanolyticus TaxID=990 RepID=A0A2W7NFI2_9BACT|nr:putative secreted protein (Por secretion system target) [Breznakibacter xylanolyticus]
MDGGTLRGIETRHAFFLLFGVLTWAYLHPILVFIIHQNISLMKTRYPIALMLLFILVVPMSGQSMLDDTFEEYQVDDPIATTGWLEWHSGAGGHQVVLDGDRNNNALQINGQSGWAGEYYKEVTFGTHAMVGCWVKPKYASGFNASLSLMNGTDWVCRVSFDGGKIWAVEGNDYSNKKELTGLAYSAGQWTFVVMLFNQQDLTFSVLINGLPATSGTTRFFKMSKVPSRVLLTGGHNGDDTRFDDVTASDMTILANYPFNGNANDVLPYFNHGTIHGATFVADRHGNANSAIAFDGVDDYVLCDMAVGPYGGQARTVTFWAMTDATPVAGQQSNTVLSYGGDISTGGSRFEVLLNAQCQGIGVDGSVGYVNRSFDNSGGGWHFYAVVLEPASGMTLSDLKLYVDGVSAGDVCAISSPSVSVNTTVNEPLNIGRLYYSGQPRYFKGALDDLMIYNLAFTPEQIKALYDANKPSSISSTTRDDLGLTLSPNPCREQFRIEGLVVGVPTRIELLNVHQQVVGTLCSSFDAVDVNVAHLPVGIYWVRVMNGQRVQVMKMVKR